MSLWKYALHSLYLDHCNCILRVPWGPLWRSGCPVEGGNSVQGGEKQVKSMQRLSCSVYCPNIGLGRAGTCSVLLTTILVYPVPRVRAATLFSVGPWCSITSSWTNEVTDEWMSEWMDIYSYVVILTTRRDSLNDYLDIVLIPYFKI